MSYSQKQTLKRHYQFFFTLCVAFFLLCGCKKTDIASVKQSPSQKEIKVKDMLFDGVLDNAKEISAMDLRTNIKRTLTPYQSDRKKLIERYVLKEENLITGIKNEVYVVTNRRVGKNVNLFSFPMNKDIVYFDAMKNSFVNCGMTLKHTGKLIEMNSVIKVENTNVNSAARPGSPIEGYCIDHWWITWDAQTGQVISIDYLGSDCYPVPGGGGSGGNPSPTNPSSCAAERDRYLGIPVSENQSISIVSSYSYERTENYVWKIYKQNFGLWSFSSHEQGVHKNTNYKTGNPTPKWQWKSLTHQTVSRAGMVIGGTVECVVNSSTPTVGLYTAGMELNYNINSSLVCSGSPLTFGGTYNSRKTWSVND